LEHRLTELQRDSNSRDCQIEDLTLRLTTETYRARKAEGDWRKALEEVANTKAEKQELEAKLESMQQGSKGLQNDLDSLETENTQLLQQLAAIR
jgi:chromosome segregation ATPase